MTTREGIVTGPRHGDPPGRPGCRRSLFAATGACGLRSSSWDRSGRNRDLLSVQPGEAAVLLEHDGPDWVRHLCCAVPSTQR